jgi:diaminohydroxyphosphoribosylaminopyrimidine deaminase/5-amino-6-(5-phosphoribosylamino)uracil reductase
MNHSRFMSRALQLADSQLGLTAPNPAVGCVLVRDGQIIAEAATADGGRPHAETQAIEKAGDCAGATAYVTLEPCAHHGKTPPCAEAIVKAGIKHAVIAVRDPDPRTSGRGIEILKNAGIEVIEGVMADEATRLNAIRKRQNMSTSSAAAMMPLPLAPAPCWQMTRC